MFVDDMEVLGRTGADLQSDCTREDTPRIPLRPPSWADLRGAKPVFWVGFLALWGSRRAPGAPGADRVRKQCVLHSISAPVTKSKSRS